MSKYRIVPERHEFPAGEHRDRVVLKWEVQQKRWCGWQTIWSCDTPKEACELLHQLYSVEEVNQKTEGNRDE